MRRVISTKTATGRRLQKRRKRITPAKNKGLTPEQVAYRKHRKKLGDYYKRERQLERYRP